ncbi:peptidyl-prolyl cis-trans isomerase, EpsD family [Hahella sp. KA22]|uniref:EpsD family peptidyl-prolyl cis-trans isomerase n=1 Tax=Hahella sp. KA22 TaxID=1628392 RepID=UPI000FDF3F5F|nr:EpsD family peptidyl-prolyl cis-trans isomerase [Hahella sp. KA22]AZZ92499.1 peptidyl-prolyl cis-trans isomerase, EpsD family [Hahella sp. KA22]QAY55873.1 peptidyl-prolyl cis-trans isomerase, EpsD family [Hahella sp. KA22]
MFLHRTSYPKFVFLTALTGSLAGCGGAGEATDATQVVAKVNGSEISIHQLNAILAKQPSQGVSSDTARAQALDELVEQQVAYDKAVELKLDRSPDVVMAIESMKKSIIARAYLQQVIGALSQPSQEDIHQYYAEHPALFAERKLYSLQEVAIEPRRELLAPLNEKVNSAEQLEDIVSWLKSEGVQYRVNAANRSAEQIGLELLTQVARLEDGAMTLFQGPNNYLVVRVTASQQRPVSEEDAKPRITQYLHNLKVQKTVTEEVERLKNSAAIEYVGDFKRLAIPAAGGEAGVEIGTENSGVEGGEDIRNAEAVSLQLGSDA